MDDFATNWTQMELKAYMLMYCAYADFVITAEEKELIKSKVGLNEYQKIQKINSTIARFDYSQEELDEIFQSIKSLFLSDGEMDILEKNIYRGLKKLLQK